jgi:IS605 OrfB family transposase
VSEKATITLTAKLKIHPSEAAKTQLLHTFLAYKKGCNRISNTVFKTKQLQQPVLQRMVYHDLRSEDGLKSQMAQSAIKTVIARYKSARTNGHPWTCVLFKRNELDLVWNRDYSLSKTHFSVNTLDGRIKVAYERKGMEHFFDGTWEFGTAKLVYKNKNYYLHIPMTKAIDETDANTIRQVVGVDFGINFLLTTYDSKGKTTFINGRPIKNKRSHFKAVRKGLQKRQTPSSRRKLKNIGNRENRWMTDINHQTSKALVNRYASNTLFCLEDLTGIRGATEKVRKKDRYEIVSWAFYQLRTMITYKAQLKGSTVVAVDPRHTSQQCPKCGHTERANRIKKLHRFCCKTCGYRSNDDRIGAMNLWQKGVQWVSEQTSLSASSR